MPAIRPPHGIRFTWTSVSPMKMLIRRTSSLSTRDSKTFSTDRTRPSAGETIASGSAGIVRRGFLKNQTTNAASPRKRTPTIGQPTSHAAPAAASGAATKGSPSTTTGKARHRSDGVNAATSPGASACRPCPSVALILVFIHEAALLEPRHHRAQARADLLDGVGFALAQQRVEHGAAGAIL